MCQGCRAGCTRKHLRLSSVFSRGLAGQWAMASEIMLERKANLVPPGENNLKY
jgi:hypothetical protein